MTTTKYLVRINRVPTADATTRVSGFFEIQVQRFCLNNHYESFLNNLVQSERNVPWAIDCRVEINISVPWISLHQCNAETRLCCALLPRAGRASPSKTKNMLRIVAVGEIRGRRCF
tara:strand:+ start:169 stop:516 length:348 start_codon:yes stop_codon:yes gene_type:complete